MRVMTIMGIALLALPVAASGQLMSAWPAPDRAETRTFTWEEMFPVNPPFAQWTREGTFEDGSMAWLHAASIVRQSDGHMRLDVLVYKEAGTGGQPGYARGQVTLFCDTVGTALIQASADVTIDPAGTIVPVSPVMEGGVLHASAKSLIDAICTDQAFRMRFGADG